jgi:hypothetical protein
VEVSTFKGTSARAAEGKGWLAVGAGVFLLGIAWGALGGMVGEMAARSPMSQSAYLTWERKELKAEIIRRREAHDRRSRAGGADLGALEAEEREIAGMAGILEVLNGKRK